MLEVHMRMHGPGFYKAGRVEESMSQTFEHKVNRINNDIIFAVYLPCT